MLKRVYAVGDCVNFIGPKLGHMAARQAEVAANKSCDGDSGVLAAQTLDLVKAAQPHA